MVYGKVIGGLIGLLVGGLFGLIIGVFVGHAFDRGLVNTLKFGSPENIERIKTSFFETTFLLSGYVAKADGRVSEQEVAHTESIFTQLNLNAAQRKQAIELLRQLAKNTPDVTMVAAWMSAETGVGPSIASGNQRYNGNCALLPHAPTNNNIAIAVAVTGANEPE